MATTYRFDLFPELNGWHRRLVLHVHALLEAHVGKHNAIPGWSIRDRIFIPTQPNHKMNAEDLCNIIECLRNSDPSVPILACGKGYYMAANGAELLAFLDGYSAVAFRRLKTVKVMKDSARFPPRQMRLQV